jgi:hypothetical protein
MAPVTWPRRSLRPQGRHCCARTQRSLDGLAETSKNPCTAGAVHTWAPLFRFPYDAVARHASLLARMRHSTTLHYASPAPPATCRGGPVTFRWRDVPRPSSLYCNNFPGTGDVLALGMTG